MIAYWEGGVAEHPLTEGKTITIGRSSRSDLRIDHTSVSRQHAAVHAGRPTTLEDLGSSYGTRVSGQRIATGERVPVGAGTVIEIGRAIVLVEDRLDPEPPSPQDRRAARAATRVSFDAMVAVVAPTPMTVLLLGETGVGKGVVAERIHRASQRAENQFLALNCGALPESLLEAELFGHEKGAFTGATNARAGLLESASGGTVFLDEVGEMPLTTQVKLLRVFEEREVLRVGARRPTPIDVRFIAATNRDLAAMVEEGRFRRDLYYRIRGVPIAIPPLRERREEIARLARAFIERGALALGRPPPALAPRALAELERHSWPGNVRELRSTLERAVLFASHGEVDVEHLELDVVPASAPDKAEGTLRQKVEDAERERILSALEQTQGNQSRAAELLGISRRTLLRRLDEYALPRPRKTDDPNVD